MSWQGSSPSDLMEFSVATASNTSSLVCVEAPSENLITEITYDGQEIYQLYEKRNIF